MEGLDYWRLCDELSVLQAALLIVGCDPGGEAGYCEGWPAHERPAGYEAAKAALKHAILGSRLSAVIRRQAWERGWDEEPGDNEEFTGDLAMFLDQDPTKAEIRATFREKGMLIKRRGVIYRAEPDWQLTTVRVDALRQWLAGRGIKTGFFFPTDVESPDYLNPQHPRYAPKLAAAVRAWLAVDDPKGKHPKTALVKWLREHGADYALSDDEGKPNELGIEECAKVANWQPGGGAPKTPGT